MTQMWGDTLAEEMGTSHFRDRRLRVRLRNLVSKLLPQPDRSFPKALSSAELEGAYRFFGNPVVTPDLVLSGHYAAVRERAAAEDTVLCVHDTTKCSFREDGQREGLGRVMKGGQAFFAHCTLALCADASRTPLGVVALTPWARLDEADGRERERWGAHVSLAEKRLSGANIVHLMDREGDDYPLFSQLIAGNHRFVIRSMHDRLIEPSDHEGARKLYAATATLTCEVTREAKLSKRVEGARSPKQKKIHPARSTRTATLSVAATTVTLLRPRPVRGECPESLTLHVVRVWEATPPEGEPGVEWTLLTTEPIDTIDQLLRIVDFYRARWTIEEYFKALKTGCAFEARQLGDYDSLINALALFAPIACQMLLLRGCAKRTPDALATEVVSEEEIEILRAIGRTKLPVAPTVRDVFLAIAALGGHIKYAPDPGWLTLARGFAELRAVQRGWRAAKLQYHWDQR